MKRIGLNQLIFIFAAIFLISSCGEYGKNGISGITGRSVGDIVNIKADLSEIESNNIRNICSKLRTMRLNLRSISNLDNVKFNVTYGSCTSTSSERDVFARVEAFHDGRAILTVRTNQYDNPGTLLETIVQNDLNGVVGDFCGALANGKDVNTIYANFVKQGLVYSFADTNTFSRNVVIENNSETRLVEKQIYKIESNSQATSNLMVEKIEYQSLCANGKAKVDTQSLIDYSNN